MEADIKETVMTVYEIIEKRRTIRDFEDRPIDPDIIERIIGAGLKAPSNDHMRSWEFIVIHDKQQRARIISKIPKTLSAKRVDFIMDSWQLNDMCQRHMYKDAIPKQYAMLLSAGCLILPLFKQEHPLLEPKTLSDLNAFASIWCCIENMLLAATAEGLAGVMRIPLGNEPEHVREAVGHPKNYRLPCYLALGYPASKGSRQHEIDVRGRIHQDFWQK